jgi:hypothetical protein
MRCLRGGDLLLFSCLGNVGIRGPFALNPVVVVDRGDGIPGLSGLPTRQTLGAIWGGL